MRLHIEYSKIYIFLVVGQFFFFETNRLRINPYIFWPIATALAIIHMRKFRLDKVHLYNVIAFAYCLVACVITDERMTALSFLAEIAMYFLCIYNICKDENSRNTMFNFAFGFAVFHLLMIYIQRLLPSVFNVLSLVLRGVSSSAFTSGNSNITIYTGLTGQSSVISLYLIIGLLLSLRNTLLTQKKCYIALDVAFLIGIFLTNRRANALCGVALLLCVLLLEKRNIFKKLFYIAVGVVAFLLIGYQNIPGVAGLIDKINTGIKYNNILSGREGVWETAIALFKSSPWFGIGFFELSNHIDTIHAHNSFLQKLAELGVVGSIVFFAPFVHCLISSIKSLLRSIGNNKCSNISRADSIVNCAFFCYTGIISLTEGMFETPIFYIILFLFQNNLIYVKKRAVQHI